ncbi:MAG: SMP-30/gluconolactonase/LRE family protein [bacterium]
MVKKVHVMVFITAALLSIHSKKEAGAKIWQSDQADAVRAASELNDTSEDMAEYSDDLGQKTLADELEAFSQKAHKLEKAIGFSSRFHIQKEFNSLLSRWLGIHKDYFPQLESDPAAVIKGAIEPRMHQLGSVVFTYWPGYEDNGNPYQSSLKEGLVTDETWRWGLMKIDPLPFHPLPKPEMTGAYEPNDVLQEAELLGLGRIKGPEDIAFDEQGRIYGGSADGLIYRILKDGTVEVFAETGGRPLGMEFSPDGNLIVCDPYQGLLSIDQHGLVRILATEADGVRINFADAVTVAMDGTIYFTDASYKYTLEEFHLDCLEARPNGRLITYDPISQTTQVLLRDLYFANGVALSRHEDFILVNETYRYRITRYWLKGDRAGTREVFMDNLPGLPDGISSNRKGMFWVAMFTVRNNILDGIHPHPGLKKFFSLMPESIWSQPKPYGFVVGIHEHGEPVVSFHDPTGGHLKEITSVKEQNEYLYLGSLTGDRIGRLWYGNYGKSRPGAGKEAAPSRVMGHTATDIPY